MPPSDHLPPVADRGHILTEHTNPASQALDTLSIEQAVKLMHDQDVIAVEAVGKQRAAIATAVEMAAAAFRLGGRLIYVGAGTSGRLGVLDASECPPTFCADPSMVVGVIAGGAAALTRGVENVEDDHEAGVAEMERLKIGPLDVVCGIAAGGTTPFVHGALAAAQKRGAKTMFIACTLREHIKIDADLFICLETGPELLTGSTRLKAGTATKLALNTITTLAMVQIGRVYGHYMVDIDAMKNTKLVDRALRIISAVTGVQRAVAAELLAAANGQVKRAIVMRLKQCDAGRADALLAQANGNLRGVIGTTAPRESRSPSGAERRV